MLLSVKTNLLMFHLIVRISKEQTRLLIVSSNHQKNRNVGALKRLHGIIGLKKLILAVRVLDIPFYRHLKITYTCKKSVTHSRV
jgi:hypothetical protein